MQPLVDHLYVLVAVALIAGVAVLASARVRRSGGRALVGPVTVVAAAMLVLGLGSVRRTEVSPLDAELDRPPARPAPELAPAPAPTVPPPPMRQVPVPTSGGSAVP